MHNMTEKYTMGVISNYILLFPLLFTHSLKLLKTTSDSYLRMKMDYFFKFDVESEYIQGRK